MKCGFGPNGAKAKTHKICPAAKGHSLDGVHGGLHGGRVCWFIDNTFNCGNDTQDYFSKKFPVCMNCEFYRQVKEEEGDRFEVSLLLHSFLQNK